MSNISIEYALPSSTTKKGLLVGDFTYGDEYTGLPRLYEPDNQGEFCGPRKYRGKVIQIRNQKSDYCSFLNISEDTWSSLSIKEKK